MVNVILMHGKTADPSQKWYPWFAEEVRKQRIAFEAPTLPETNDPDCAAWVKELDATNPDEHTILVGHSRGGVAILRWLEGIVAGRRVRKVILVATNSGRMKDGNSHKGFFSQQGFDFEKIRTHCNDFVVLHSRDDVWVPFEDGDENARSLHARFLTFDDRGHFGKTLRQVPELITEIDTGIEARRGHQ